MRSELSSAEAVSGDWLPVHLQNNSDQPEITWCQVSNLDLAKPFLVDSLRKLRRESDSAEKLRYSSLSAFMGFAQQLQQTDYTTEACLFHMSRCGSTLVCNVLKQAPECLVLSEPQPLDFILRQWQPDCKEAFDKALVLRTLFRFWNAVAYARKQRLFVKPDCWLNLSGDCIVQAAAPKKSWFLSRDLSEILASHQRQPGAFLIPELISADYYKLTDPKNDFLNPTGYQLQVLSKILGAGIALTRQTNTTLLDYEELLKGGLQLLLETHRININKAQIDGALRTHSKNKTPFSQDTEQKHSAFSADIKAVIRLKQFELMNYS